MEPPRDGYLRASWARASRVDGSAQATSSTGCELFGNVGASPWAAACRKGGERAPARVSSSTHPRRCPPLHRWTEHRPCAALRPSCLSCFPQSSLACFESDAKRWAWCTRPCVRPLESTKTRGGRQFQRNVSNMCLYVRRRLHVAAGPGRSGRQGLSGRTRTSAPRRVDTRRYANALERLGSFPKPVALRLGLIELRLEPPRRPTWIEHRQTSQPSPIPRPRPSRRSRSTPRTTR